MRGGAGARCGGWRISRLGVLGGTLEGQQCGALVAMHGYAQCGRLRWRRCGDRRLDLFNMIARPLRLQATNGLPIVLPAPRRRNGTVVVVSHVGSCRCRWTLSMVLHGFVVATGAPVPGGKRACRTFRCLGYCLQLSGCATSQPLNLFQYGFFSCACIGVRHAPVHCWLCMEWTAA